MKKTYLKIFLPSILSILLFILTIFLIIIPRYEQNVMNGKREMIKELTNTAISILSKYENDEKEGLLNREQAQKTAISRIEYLRYGEENKDYFWITDTTPVMIIHPHRKDLNGKDLSNFSDPHGKKLFVEFVKTVKSSDHGYVDYMWQWKDDSSHIVPKLSYVRIFKPWNWVIGTGVYIEDIKKEITALTKRMSGISTGIALLIASLLIYVFVQSIKAEQRKNKAERGLKESREKYMTLVEAATEGLVMLTDGKITFANNLFCKLTGYENDELNERLFTDIIGKNNNTDVINAFSHGLIKDGQYEISLLKKEGSSRDVLLISSTTIFYGKTVNIIIAKDLSAGEDISFTNVDYKRLIHTLNVGFFKAGFQAKGRFIFADHTAIRIFGFDSFEDISQEHPISLVEDEEERMSITNQLFTDGFVRNKKIKIADSKGNTTIASVSLSVVGR
ncbi:MAG: cache domain-containing protein [Chitinophagaceae bacterium]|nr:cache domain-containing protein [Chitinophagaceae bacterium]